MENNNSRYSRLWSKISKDPLASLFFGLYIIVALATFRHSAIGFASIEGGSLFWGAMSALAVDIGMMLSATGLRKRTTFWLVAGLLISAGASTYTQLLFSIMHAQDVTIAPGAAWLSGVAIWIVQKRVLIMPALLPVLSIVYAFSAKDERENGDLVLEQEQNKILSSSPATKTERCRAAWVAHTIDARAEDISGVVGCHISLARKVRKELIEEMGINEESL